MADLIESSGDATGDATGRTTDGGTARSDGPRGSRHSAGPRRQRSAARRYLAAARRAILFVAGLKGGTDPTATVTRIREGVRLRGANLWILVCAAILASIGLNTSSAAVIIGAMLISPLMGPILGIGLGIAIHDRVMLLRALRVFGVAIGVSLLTSIIYFAITPITIPTPELLARTSPTLLDVAVAFFGGIAGIVAGSRREVTTAIPGVAIATALMPPLCTAGFGLATGNWIFFWGALYLFFLNAVFISVATFLVARLIGIPYVTYVDPRAESRVVRWIAIFVVAAMVPSIVIFYDVIAELRRKGAAQRFVRDRLEIGGRKALSWSLDATDSVATLKVYLAGDPMSQQVVDSLSRELPPFGSARGELQLVQLNLPRDQEEHLTPEELAGMFRDAEVQRQLARSLVLTSTSDSTARRTDTIPVDAVRRELGVLFPTIGHVEYAEQVRHRGDTADTVRLFLVRRGPATPIKGRDKELDRMRAFLATRLPSDSVQVLDVVAPVDTTATTPSQRPRSSNIPRSSTSLPDTSSSGATAPRARPR